MTKGIVINKKGQLSIFLAISIVFFMTTVAFVINVGLFVKAKINLQNAVDAAAWSGAAVQARQLTDIGYLNWEMRNNYKEWLFKYYVLGNYSTKGVQNPSAFPGQSNFRLGNQFERGGAGDKYNIPSICLDSHLTSNVCSFYSLPGVPRLSNIGFTGLDQVTKELENSIATAVAKNCINATNTNFVAAQQWTYGLGQSQTNSDLLPKELIVTRPGAWTKGIELAFRVRNIEAMLNAAPGEATINSITSIEQSGLAKNERLVKSFYSAYRNLGNGSDKNLKNELKITELSPIRLADRAPSSLSNLLIPGSSEAINKYYIDLKFYPINMAIFFTTLAPKGNDTSQASCEVIKTAYPVPAFPLGFDKNQNVLTYYAVKGETKFNGLFNPFSKDGIRLVAYAAAKPFGARIGPKIFDTYSNETFVTPRGVKGDTTSSKRSSSYIFGLKPTPGGDSSAFPPILPDSESFWVQSPDEAIGGLTGSEDPKFVIPNLTYDKTGNSLDHAESIYVMNTPIEISDNAYKVGLYDPEQLSAFKGSLTSARPSVRQVADAIREVRSPTNYEAQNYLIPTTDRDNSSFPSTRVDHYGQSSTDSHGLKVFAPIFGRNAIYETDQMLSTITQFFEAQAKSIIAFRDKMYEVRQAALASAAANGEQANYVDAMNLFIDSPLSCNSVIGQLTSFLIGPAAAEIGDTTTCDSDNQGGADTYINGLTAYFTTAGQDQNFRDFYLQDYPIDFSKKMTLDKKFSAFFPGQNSGGTGENGDLNNPIRGNRPTKSLRNFYSTKLISLSHVRSEKPLFLFKYSEGKGGGVAQGDTAGGKIENLLEENTQLDEVKNYQ